MEAIFTKERLIKTIQEMPDGFTAEDVIERIILLDSIEEARAQLRNGEGISDEDFYKHLPAWLNLNGRHAH